MLNPTAAQLVTAVDAAFAAAAERQATLLLAFVGHGVATNADDFYLLGQDSPAIPNSRNAFHFTQEIRERLNQSPLDGLVVLIDACEAGHGVLGAAQRWTDLLAQSAGRMEMLVAVGQRPAFAGCFTRTMLATFDEGLPLSGENLLPADLVDPIAEKCAGQAPHHLSFTPGMVSVAGRADPGLWLVPNAARFRDAVSGRSTAGFVDQLTRGLLVTPDVREYLATIVNAGSNRLRVLIGPGGAGKSTLLAVLIRPSLVEGLAVTPEYITAAVFLTTASSIEAVAAEFAVQLSARLPGFAEMARVVRAHRPNDELDIFDVSVLDPLARLSTMGRRVTMVLDGLNQPQEGTRRLLISAVADLTQRADLRHVRVIASARDGTGIENDPALAHMCRIDVSEPTADDIATVVGSARGAGAPADPDEWVAWIQLLLAETSAAEKNPRHLVSVSGGWLLARMLAEVASSITDGAVAAGVGLDRIVALRVDEALRGMYPEAVDAMAAFLGVLVAAGVGAVLPIQLFEDALAALGNDLRIARIRDMIVALGALVSRSRPGTIRELLGVAHAALLVGLRRECERLGGAVEDAHRAIVTAIRELSSDRATDYARGSAVRHCLAYGDSASALDFLERLQFARAVDSSHLWQAWIPTFIQTLGIDHPHTLTARNREAYHRAESGDLISAIKTFEELLASRLRVLGPDDLDTVNTRMNLARYLARAGDYVGAQREFSLLLTDQERLLGPDHPDILRTRHDLASGRADLGDIAGAIDDFHLLLTDSVRLLGDDNPQTLSTRNSIAVRLGEVGDFQGARTASEQLLADCVRIYGPVHPATLEARNNLAVLRARSGDLISARTEFSDLLAERLRALGPDHPDTLRTRSELASSRADLDDLSGATEELENLLADQLRVLGPDHPQTFDTRRDLADCRARLGDLPRAIMALEILLVAQLRALGPTHPGVARTQTTLAEWRIQLAERMPAHRGVEGHRALLEPWEYLRGWGITTGEAADAALRVFEECIHEYDDPKYSRPEGAPMNRLKAVLDDPMMHPFEDAEGNKRWRENGARAGRLVQRRLQEVDPAIVRPSNRRGTKGLQMDIHLLYQNLIAVSGAAVDSPDNNARGSRPADSPNI
ncbi:tetratricopeptide repeat protein [Nocardia brasiliensis]|uniref:tetratricopeptide repeat protein n=1 Tax=Nocardia brasiliensis TaxID=37326 RepID=UPI0024590C2D|nr:tetratricopeptide repeat protein [Nocardia brasiliensis]